MSLSIRFQPAASCSHILRFPSDDTRSSRTWRFVQRTLVCWRHLVVCEQLQRHHDHFQARRSAEVPARALAKATFRVWAAVVVNVQNSSRISATIRRKSVECLIETNNLAFLSHVWIYWKFSSQRAQESRRAECRYVILELIRSKTSRLARDVMRSWYDWILRKISDQKTPHSRDSISRLQQVACVAKLAMVRWQRIDLIIAILFEWCRETYRTRRKRLLEDGQLLHSQQTFTRVKAFQTTVAAKQAVRRDSLSLLKSILVVWRQEVKAQKYQARAEATEQKLIAQLEGVLKHGGASPLASTFQVWTEATLRYQNAQRAEHIQELQYQAQQLHQKVESLRHHTSCGTHQQERTHRYLAQALVVLNSTKTNSALHLTLTLWWQHTCVAIHERLIDGSTRSQSLLREKMVRALVRMLAIQYHLSAIQVMNAWHGAIQRGRIAEKTREAAALSEKVLRWIPRHQFSIESSAAHRLTQSTFSSWMQQTRIFTLMYAKDVGRMQLEISQVIAAWRQLAGHLAREKLLESLHVREDRSYLNSLLVCLRLVKNHHDGLSYAAFASWKLIFCDSEHARARTWARHCVVRAMTSALKEGAQVLLHVFLISWRELCSNRRKLKESHNCYGSLRLHHATLVLLRVAMESWKAVVADVRWHEQGLYWQGRTKTKLDSLVCKMVLPSKDRSCLQLTTSVWKRHVDMQRSSLLAQQLKAAVYDSLLELSHVVLAKWRAHIVGIKDKKKIHLQDQLEMREVDLDCLHDKVQHLQDMVRSRALQTADQWILSQEKLLVQILFTTWRAWTDERLRSINPTGSPLCFSSERTYVQKIASLAFAVERYAPLSVVATAGLVVDSKREVQHLKELFSTVCRSRTGRALMKIGAVGASEFLLYVVNAAWKQVMLSRKQCSASLLHMRCFRGAAHAITSMAQVYNGMLVKFMLSSWRSLSLQSADMKQRQLVVESAHVHLRTMSNHAGGLLSRCATNHDLSVQLNVLHDWRERVGHVQSIRAASFSNVRIASRWACHLELLHVQNTFCCWRLVARLTYETKRRKEHGERIVGMRQLDLLNVQNTFCCWRLVARLMYETRRCKEHGERMHIAWHWQAERRWLLALRDSIFSAWASQVRHARWLRYAVFSVSRMDALVRCVNVDALIRCMLLAWKSSLSDTRTTRYKYASDRVAMILQDFSCREATKAQEICTASLIQVAFYRWARRYTGRKATVACSSVDVHTQQIVFIMWRIVADDRRRVEATVKLQSEVDRMSRELVVARASCERRRGRALAIMEGSMNAALFASAVKTSLPEILPTPVDAG